MRTVATAVKLLLLLAGSFLYLLHSFEFGYQLTSDMHNGGPFVGPLLFPVLLAAAAFLLFINRPKVRLAVAFGLLAYGVLVALTVYDFIQ
jgi:hypothetical protein